MLGERVVCATISLPLVHASVVLPATLAAAFYLQGLNNVVCRVMQITFAKGNPDTGLLTKQMFHSSPGILTRGIGLCLMFSLRDSCHNTK